MCFFMKFHRKKIRQSPAETVDKFWNFWYNL